MREVTCPVYPCVWSILTNEGEMLEAFADIAFRVHLRSHDADHIIAGFEALTAQNTRQLKHLGAINDELYAARQQQDRMQAVVDAAREVVGLLRLLDELGLSGSVTGPSRTLVAAMADYDATVEVADVRS